MPNRIIKESICTSDSIQQLNWLQEVLFYRLIVNCDDYGRMDARPAILKGRLFPLKSGLTESQIEEALNSLSMAGIVLFYSYDGKPYLQLVNWAKHQKIRNKKSKYPSPEEADGRAALEDYQNGTEKPDIRLPLKTVESNCTQLKSIENNCDQLQSIVSNCARNPIQSESNPNPNPIQTREGARGGREKTNQPENFTGTSPAEKEVWFTQFWEAYPKHVNKPAAWKAFQTACTGKYVLMDMLKAIDQQKNSAQWKDSKGKYIPYPANWLSDRRWEDAILPETGGIPVSYEYGVEGVDHL